MGVVKLSENLYFEFGDLSRVEFHANGGNLYFKNAPASVVVPRNEFSSERIINPAIKPITKDQALRFKEFLERNNITDLTVTEF